MTNSQIAAAEIALVGAIEAGWDEHLPVHWPNATFPGLPADWDQPWLDVDILWGDGAAFTMGLAGVGRNVVAGLLQLTVNGARGGGRGDLLALADGLRDLFTRKSIGALRFGVASGPMPGNPNEAWESLIVRVPFEHEETF